MAKCGWWRLPGPEEGVAKLKHNHSQAAHARVDGQEYCEEAAGEPDPLIDHELFVQHVIYRCVVVSRAYGLGFAQTQRDPSSKESPRSVKPLLYVYRVLLTGIHLMRSGEIEANVDGGGVKMIRPYVQ